MNNLNFGEVLTRAWQIIWKHRVLWLFGILASCAQGGGSGGNGGGGNSGGSNSTFDPNNPQFSRTIQEAQRWFEQNLWIVIAIGILILLLSIAFIFIGYIGKIALIKGAYKADNGAEKITFAELWSESLPYFWRVFGLAFIIWLIVFVVLLILIIPLVILGVATMGAAMLCIIPIICILFPFLIILGIIMEQTNAAIILENLSMLDGLKRGWNIFKTNWGAILIMWLILGIGGGIISLIFALPIFIIVFPAMLAMANGTTNMLWIAGLCFVIYLPVLIVLQGILIAYIQTAWTLVFMRLSKPTELENNTPIITQPNA